MPRPTVRLRPALLAAAVLALGACGRDATSPSALSDTEVSVDVASRAGEVATADLAAFGNLESIAGLGPSGTSGCAIVSGRHRCGTVTASGVSTTRSYAYHDASGATMAAYDATTTASLDVLTDVAGHVSGTTRDGTFSSTFTRSRSETLSGLAGAETQRTWNGVAAGRDSTVVTVGSETRTYVGSAADTTSNVVVRLPRSSNPYPVSGQRIRTLTAHVVATGPHGASRQISRRAVVTFNGTATVPLTVNGVACTLHLDTRTVDGCTRP